MDPSSEEVESLTTLQAIIEWVGMEAPIAADVLRLLGMQPDQHPRALANVAIPDLEAVLNG